jgi:hypothetical protein
MNYIMKYGITKQNFSYSHLKTIMLVKEISYKSAKKKVSSLIQSGSQLIMMKIGFFYSALHRKMKFKYI